MAAEQLANAFDCGADQVKGGLQTLLSGYLRILQHQVQGPNLRAVTGQLADRETALIIAVEFREKGAGEVVVFLAQGFDLVAQRFEINAAAIVGFEIVTIINDGHNLKQGRAVSTDVVQGSVESFLNALNR